MGKLTDVTANWHPCLQLRVLCAGLDTGCRRLSRPATCSPALCPSHQRGVRRFSSEAESIDPPTQPPKKPEQTHGNYPGDVVLEYTSKLHVVDPQKVRQNALSQLPFTAFGNPSHLRPIPRWIQSPKWPVYRVTETDGSIRQGAHDPGLDRATVTRMYQTMVRLQVRHSQSTYSYICVCLDKS